MVIHKKRSRQPVLRVLLALIVLLALSLALGFGYLFSRYAWVAGGFREKDSAWMNLRGEKLTLEEFDELTQAFPECDILWDVPLQGTTVPSDSRAVTVSDLTGTDWQALERLPNLTALNAAGCRDYQGLADFQLRHPECQVNYTVSLGGQEYSNDIQSITVVDADGAQLEQLLPYLPQLTRVELTGLIPDSRELGKLIADFPDLSFCWRLSPEGGLVDSTATELDIQGGQVCFDEV